MLLGKYINGVMSTVNTENPNLYKDYKPIVEIIKPDEKAILNYEDNGNYYLQSWNLPEEDYINM